MKYYCTILIALIFFHLSGYSQDFWQKLSQERQQYRLENRKINDPIYKTGDTLYLLYNHADSLQAYYPKREMVSWKKREMTPEEAQNPYASEWNDLFLSNTAVEFHLFPLKKNDPKIKTSEDLEKIALTSRKELMDFYGREYKRLGGKIQSSGKKEDLFLSEWDLCNYFLAIYMIIPQDDGTFKMFIISRERRGE